MANKRTIAAALMASAMLWAVPDPCGAQGFLKKLKQKAESAIGAAVVGTGADETAGEAEPEEEAPAQNTPQRVWEGEATPSKATDAAALLKELPAFPSAQAVAGGDYKVREAYEAKISAVVMQAGDLKTELVSAEGPAPSPMSEEERKMIEQLVMSQMASVSALANISPEQVEKDRVRAEEIEKEVDAMAKKYPEGKPVSPADQKRMEELTAELQAMQTRQMPAINQANSASDHSRQLADQIKAKTDNPYDNKFNAFRNKLEDLVLAAEGDKDPGAAHAAALQSQVGGIYRQIWAETDASKVKALYAQADELSGIYQLRGAEARLSTLKKLFDEAKAMMPEAASFKTNIPDESLIARGELKSAEYDVVNACAQILYAAFGTLPDLAVTSCQSSTIALPLQAGDNVMSGESNIMGMANPSGLKMVIDGNASAEDTLEKDFLNSVVLLVYNGNSNKYFKIERGQRVALAGDGPFNFWKAADRRNAPSGNIPTKSGRVVKYDEMGLLTLPDGSTYEPIAMQRTADWLIFITANYSGEFTKWKYRL